MDGVLCAPRACIAMGNEGGASYLDPVGCMLVRNLCEDFDCRLVISSTWRFGLTLESFKMVLNAACPNLGNYIFEDQIDWRTSEGLAHYPDPENRRGSEIQDWLRRNDLYTKMFIILDDDSDIAPYQDFHVKCHVYDGITFAAYLKARALLGDA